MYILLNTDKDCDLLQDRPVLSTGRTPHDKQNRKGLDYNQNLVMSPGGGSTPGWTDWLTDWRSLVKWLWLRIPPVLMTIA